jgi:hypothetical protein
VSWQHKELSGFLETLGAKNVANTPKPFAAPETVEGSTFGGLVFCNGIGFDIAPRSCSF